MDVIKTFNQELSSLYDTKPPISKAKITAITRSAIRAIKFYKHVVQSVEKFIMKCKPEYKVPALYVIDSLVRQSRHQFQDKDVFGPRFARNLKSTFQHLYQVPPEDKSKIIRVLNLWQKNEVFTPDIIHPLFDMADPNHPIHRELAEIQARNGVENSNKVGIKPSPGLSSKHGADLSSAAGKSTSQTDLLQQLQHLQSLLQNHGSDKDAKVKFDKKLLDFDYGEEENEEEKNQTAADALGSILSNPEVLKQLQTLQNQTQSQFQKIDFDSLQRERDKKEHEMALQEKEFDKHLAATLPKLPFASVCEFKPDDVTSSNSSFQHFNLQATSTFPNMDMTVPPPGYPKKEQADFDERIPPFSVQTATVTAAPPQTIPQQQQPVVIDLDKIDSESDSNDKTYTRSSKRSHRSRSTSRSRTHRHRSRSGSRSRSSRRRRSRSYDRDKDDKPERHFDKDKEAERRKKSLPPFKKNHLAVCSTTLWIGHLSKLVQEEELSDTFGEYGDVVSINLIPPRGCAFVCMNRRQDAAKALYKLKNTKLQGKTITLAWAPGKGMKDKDWKDFWEVQDGVSYIPYDRLSKDIDYDYLEDGGVFDEDTVPLWLKDHLRSIRKKQEDETQNDSETPTVSSTKGDLIPSTSSSSENTGFIPLPEATVTQVSLPMPSASPPVVPSVPTVTPQTNATAPHPLMLPFGLPRLLGPMGMAAMTPTGLMPNVPLGVPPPALFKVHQQLLNRMPPPGNIFNQNLGDFPDGMLSLPFGLQHLQSTLQQQPVAPAASPVPSNKDATPEKQQTETCNPLLNPSLFGAPFSLTGQFPPNFPLMSVPPPSAGNTVQNLNVPPPAIVKKDEELDDDVIMEDTQKKTDDRDEKKDDRRGYNKDRNDRNDRNDSRNDKYRDRHRERERDREDRWGRNSNNRGGRNHSPKRNSRDGNNRSSRWNQDNDRDDKMNSNDVKPWNKPNSNQNNSNNRNSNNFNDSKNRDENINQPPPNFNGPPPNSGPGNGPPPNPGPGLLRTPGPPPFIRAPGAPHMFGPNGPPPPPPPLRNRFDGPSGPNNKLNGPPEPNNRFDGPDPNNRFDGPPGPNNRFDGPPGPNNRFDGPPGPNNRFDGPPGPNNRFDGPPGPNNRFDGPPGPNNRFDGPPGPNNRFDGPPGPNNRFDGPPGPNNRFDGPPGPNNRFDGPPGPNNRFDGPPGPNNRFDGPGPNNRFDGPGPNSRFDGPGPNSRFDGPGPNSRFDGPGPNNRFDGPPGTNNRNNQDNMDNFDRFPGPPGPTRRGDNFPPRGPPFMPPGGPGPQEGDNFPPGPPGFSPRGLPPRGPLPRALLGIRPDAPRPAIEPFRPRNPKLFGMKNLGPPVPLGAIPRQFRFQGKGPSSDESDNRSPVGRRNAWNTDDQTDPNREDDAEPRTKRSRWGENKNEPDSERGTDNVEKDNAPEAQVEPTANPEVSSVTNPTPVDEPSSISETPKQTKVEQTEVPVSSVDVPLETKSEIAPDSVKESFPKPETLDSSDTTSPITNKHEEPLSKQPELPTQGPGETNDSFTKIEEPKSSLVSNDEIVCDSTVD